MSLHPQLSRNLGVIYAAALLRSMGVGLTGVVLGVYLARAGFSPTRIGLVIAAGLAGGSVGTLLVTFCADPLGRRLTLLSLSVLGALGGLGFALASNLPGILILAFIGMINGMGTDRGPMFALEQAMIPQTTASERRTWALASYSVVLDAGHALGALIAAVPLFLHHQLGLDLLTAYKLTFGFYAVLNLLSAVPYLLLSSGVEVVGSMRTVGGNRPKMSPQSRSVVTRLAALSGIDSMGGGLLTDALIAYWFFRRFGISEESLGLLFFAGHLLNSASYFVAAWLARHVGLVNTMVFTHIPSSLFLMAVPLAPSPAWAIALFLGREALVEMDVPTRQSYILAVVKPHERTFSSGVTNLTRNIARSISPSFAGYVMQHLALAAPLFLGGGIKIVYDLLLYGAFRRLKPPEEQSVSGPTVVSTGRAPGGS